jgi:hypothetical protein
MAHQNQWQLTTLENLEDGEVFKFVDKQPCLSYAKNEDQLLLYKSNGVVYRYINGKTIGVFDNSEAVNKFIGSEDKLPELVH